ncbi:hypothetical protein ANCCAN_09282, partial [Ancylostoma caninum]
MEDAGLRKARVRKSKSSKKEEKKGKEESADEEKRKQKDDGTAAKNLQKPLQEIAPRQQPLKEASSESLEKKIGESVLKEVETRDYDRVDTKELNEYLRELENLKGNTSIGNENKKEVKSDDEPHGIESFIELYSLKNGDEVKKKKATRRAKKDHEKKSVHEVGKSEKQECLESLAKTQEDDSLKESRGKSLESPNKTNKLKKEEESKSIEKEESFKSAKAYREEEKTQEELQELNKEEVDRTQKGLLKQEKPPVEPKSTAVKEKVGSDSEVKESENRPSKKGAVTDVKEGKPEAQKEQDKKAGELKKIASETKVG